MTDGARAPSPTWRFAWRSGPVWDSTGGTRLVGIVNVTPDSFTDGGAHLDPARAAEHATRLVEDGADALDVGAESTRPGHVPVAADEEWRRLEPALARIRAAVSVPLSVDTRHAEVAARALDAGAQAVNDVSGLGDPEMARVVRATGAPVVLGHWRAGRAGAWTGADVLADLLAARAALLASGVPLERVAIDPGLGFGKRGEDNWRIVAALPTFRAAGAPVMVGASRKRFLAAAAGAESAGDGVRDELTAHLTVWAALAGVALVRVHAPAPSRRALGIAAAVRANAHAPQGGRPCQAWTGEAEYIHRS